MKKYLLLIGIICILSFSSCNKNDNSLKQKELDLKEKELQLKEREMNKENLNKQNTTEELQKNSKSNTAREYSSVNLNGTYSGTIKDGTNWFISITSFDGKSFSGYNIIYWKNHPEGYKTYFTGYYINSTNTIIMSEDKNTKGSGVFTGSVSIDGESMRGEWKRYSDGGLFAWNLIKLND